MLNLLSFSVIWDHVAPYGWFITFMVFATYFLYKSLMRPKLDKMREAEELAQKKKFGRWWR